MFDDFPRSRFEIVGADGKVRTTVEAINGGDTIFLLDVTVSVQPGDELRRSLPNGTDETFEVVDPRYYEETFGIPAHFQVKVRRKGLFPHHSGGNFNINVSGQNARVNVGSIDNSTNIVGDVSVFRDLTAAITSGIADVDQRANLIAAVAEMDAARGHGGFAQAYQKFISLAADHLGVIGPFLPALAGFLG